VLTKSQAVKELRQIPGVGVSLATDLWNIGITSIAVLKGKDAYLLFDQSNTFAGTIQDRCVLYVFKCAIYYANTPKEEHESEKLKWWNWKDK
jgi:hypothetical protein